MQKTILFIPAAIRSHIVPSLFLAKLMDQEYDIHYAVTNKVLEELVIQQGYAATRTSNYRVAMGMEENYLIEAGRSAQKWNILRCVQRNEILKHRLDELSEIIAKTKPSTIFIDIFNSTDMLVLYPKFHDTIKLLFINPMLSTYQIPGFPTVDQGYWPNPQEEAKSKPNLRPISFRLLLLRPVIAMISRALDRQFLQLTKAAGFSDKYPVAKDRTHALLFDNIPEIILAPLELEVSDEVRKPNQHYVGLCVHQGRQDTELDESFGDAFTKIIANKALGQKIVYCTFGTFYQGSDKALFDFLCKLLDALEGIEGIQVIFSVNHLVIQTLRYRRKLSENFHFFTRVPQLKVLEYADLYVTHGGLGSIKESIYYGVPMLVYPLDLQYDQNGNAFKVEYHELGLRGIFHHERTADMKWKMEELLLNAKYKCKIESFLNSCTLKYSGHNMRTCLRLLVESGHHIRHKCS